MLNLQICTWLTVQQMPIQLRLYEFSEQEFSIDKCHFIKNMQSYKGDCWKREHCAHEGSLWMLDIQIAGLIVAATSPGHLA